MDDIPWLYVAMIFIAFVSWLWNQIKEASEARREALAERKRAQRSRNSTEPEYDSPYRTSAGREESGSSQTSTPRDTVPEGPQSFRDVFKEIERQFQNADVEPEKPSSPPPLPKAKPTPAQDEDAGYFPEFPLDVPEIKVRPPLAKVRRRKKRGNRETSNMLRNTLRNGPKLKNALILREVLGPPRSRQSRRV